MSVLQQHGRSRRFPGQIDSRHIPEKRFAHQPFDRREDFSKRLDQTDGDVVAVDCKSLGCLFAVRSDDAIGQWDFRIKQRSPEIALRRR
jgi:hypothetical protein